jgi:hypothetical protein
VTSEALNYVVVDTDVFSLLLRRQDAGQYQQHRVAVLAARLAPAELPRGPARRPGGHAAGRPVQPVIESQSVRLTVISTPDLGVFALAAAAVLCFFYCVVDALPEQFLRRGPPCKSLVAAVFRTKRLLRERCSATCHRRRRPGQARRARGGLQITADLYGASVVCDVADHGTELPDMGADRRLAAGLAMSRGECPHPWFWSEDCAVMAGAGSSGCRSRDR